MDIEFFIAKFELNKARHNISLSYINVKHILNKNKPLFKICEEAPG